MQDLQHPGVAASGSDDAAVQSRPGSLLGLLVNTVGTFGLYSVLRHAAGLSDVAALSWSALLPAAMTLITAARTRRWDFLGILVLVALGLSLLLVALGGSARLVLVRESLVTGTLGVVLLGSLFAPRPLLFYAARYLGPPRPERRQELERRWRKRSYRRAVRLVTAVWGALLVLEAAIRIALAFTITTAQFLAVSPFIQYGILGAALAFTGWYGRRLVRRSGQPAG